MLRIKTDAFTVACKTLRVVQGIVLLANLNLLDSYPTLPACLTSIFQPSLLLLPTTSSVPVLCLLPRRCFPSLFLQANPWFFVSQIALDLLRKNYFSPPPCQGCICCSCPSYSLTFLFDMIWFMSALPAHCNILSIWKWLGVQNILKRTWAESQLCHLQTR